MQLYGCGLANHAKQQMDGMFTKLLQPFFKRADYACMLEEVKHSKQKEMRIIDTLEPVMNQHRLVVDRKVVEWDYSSTKDLPPETAYKYQMFYQMSRMTRDRGSLSHDDRLDCLAMAVAYWVETMAQDAQVRIEQRQDDLMMRELKQWEGDTKRRQVSLDVNLGFGDVMKFSFDSYRRDHKEIRPKTSVGGGGAGRCGGLLRRY